MKARTRRLLLGLATGFGVGILLVALRSTYLLESVELKTLDARFRSLRDPARADTSIIIVDIDNYSLDLARNTLGRFPWPRDVWGQVIDYLAAGGARVVAFDLTFPEPDLRDSAADATFAESAARAGMVVQAVSFQQITDSTRILAEHREDSAAIAELLGKRHIAVKAAPGTLPNFQAVEHPYPALLKSARRVGAINFEPDAVDGTARRIPLLYAFRGRVFPAFGLAAATVADSTAFDGIPVDRDGNMLINWHGPYRDHKSKRETYRVVPIAQIFKSYEKLSAGETPELPLETFRDKIVFVGASGSGLFEARANPFGAADPGVLIHATVADNILNRDFLQRAPAGVNAFVLLFVALLAGLIVALAASVWMSGMLALALAASYIGASFWLFAARNLWVDVAAPTLAILLTFTGGMIVNYVTEGRQKRQIRDMFSKYVAPEYVAQLAEDPARLHLEGRRAELSILFSDIRGFTSISEKLEPAEVISFLNEYLDEMASIVKESGGTLDKFIGDAVMAFWGEPIPAADHADRACDCALAMRDATLALAERFEREGKPAIRIGIGVNTADVVVGNIGSLKHKLDYTVIGDGVNLASRLEGLNKEYGTTIIISEFTLARLGERFETRPLGSVNVKGKAEAVRIFELLDRVAAPAGDGK